jgi:hypothetical protein
MEELEKTQTSVRTGNQTPVPRMLSSQPNPKYTSFFYTISNFYSPLGNTVNS